MTIRSEPKRARRSPESVRTDAVASARRILVERGPRAVTLKAVADDLGMRHGNITHHFGSAAGLQSAVVMAMGGDVLANITDAVSQLNRHEVSEREIVDMVFDALAGDGTDRLIAWLVATEGRDRFAEMEDAIAAFVDLADPEDDAASPTRSVDRARMVLAVLAPAMGMAMIGRGLGDTLGIESDYVRDLTAAQLRALRIDRSQKRFSQQSP